MANIDPKMVATLIVNGREYTEWESVWVQERWTESFSLFRFTANEGRLQPPSWHELQFAPGASCQIALGGQKIINGNIITRQSSANATQHLVQHTGKSRGFWPYKSSVDTVDGNMDKKTILQMADVLFKKWGGYDVVGTPDGEAAKPIEKAQVQKGETTWDFLERMARQVGVVLGVHRSGRPLLIFRHMGEVIGRVTDGDNILQIQCTISIENHFQDFFVDTSEAGSDEKSGAQTNQTRGHASGDSPVYSVLIIPMENPGDKAKADARAEYEKKWNYAAEITCNVTVPGWFSQGGMLWEAGKDVEVFSPMAMVTQVLKINTATFEQDNNKGTITTLELVAPWGRNDDLRANVAAPSGRPSVRTEPPPNKPVTNQPTPTGSPASPPPDTPATTPLQQQIESGGPLP